MKIVKLSVALLLSAALAVSAVPGGISVASAAETVDGTGDSTVTASPEPTSTVKPTNTPKPTPTVKPTSTPKPEVKLKKPKTPKFSCAGSTALFKVKYKGSKNVSGYEIRYKLTKSKKWMTQTRYITKAKSSLVKIVFASHGTYKVQVRAFNRSQGKTVYSKWAKAKKVKVKKQKVTKNPAMNYDET